MLGMNLTEKQSYALTQALGKLMSEVCEDNWAASWLTDTEETLPEACRARTQGIQPTNPNDFFTHLTDTEVAYLTYLADILGHWAKPDATFLEYLPHIPGST